MDATAEYPVNACRGHKCDREDDCMATKECQYVSSADEARALMAKLPPLEPPRFATVATTAVTPVEMKPTNPKDAIGSNKVPLHLWPETASAMGAMGMLDGCLKYGRHNFRAIGVRASIYIDAARRHLGYWFEGEDTDPDSGLPHLAHALACIAIVVDAGAAGKLNDDRMVKGGFRELMEELTAHVPRLKAKHADKNPKHYTKVDDPA